MSRAKQPRPYKREEYLFVLRCQEVAEDCAHYLESGEPMPERYRRAAASLLASFALAKPQRAGRVLKNVNTVGKWPERNGPELRKVRLLADREDMPVEDIAERLSVSVQTVKNRRQEGRNLFHHAMSKHERRK